MGLDWMLDNHKPKTGCELQYRRILKKLAQLNEDEKLNEKQHEALKKDLEAALKQVAVSPYEVIGAPQVGIDAVATEWFRREVFEVSQKMVEQEKAKPTPDPKNPQFEDRNDRLIAFWGRPFEDVLRDETGKFVVALAKDREGMASITGILCSSLDFRGQAVGCAVVVCEELQNEAFDDHDAAASVDYADRLEASLVAYKLEHPDWETRQEKNVWGGNTSAKADALDVECAVKWLRYWGSRGFGYSGWY